MRNTIDIMIGTFCIHHRLPLLHHDRDFYPMGGFLGLKTVDL
jgi:predicted nucleic acid-binding protein